MRSLNLSALRLIADPGRTSRHVRDVPTRDSCSAASGLLFNHLVGESEHRRRRLKAGQSSRLAIQTWLAAAPAVLQDPYPKSCRPRNIDEELSVASQQHSSRYVS